MFGLIQQKPAEASVKEFCQANNIRVSNYFYWRKKFSQQIGNEPSSGFLPIQVATVSGSALASIQLPGGAVITVFSAEAFSFIHSLLRENFC
jgi:hypothetical protein